MGAAFNCPTHSECRVEIWFINPCDGGPPIGRIGRLYRRSGPCGFGSLTIDGEIDMGTHGTFTITRGRLVLAIQ